MAESRLVVSAPRTLFEKVWQAHAISAAPDGETLLYVDFNFVHEGAFLAFGLLDAEKRTVRQRAQNIAFADHFVPTRGREKGIDGIADAEARTMVTQLEVNARRHGITYFGIDDPRQGIMHVVGPELGLVLPGSVITGSDSHTCTNGAFGAFAFGIGQSEIRQVFLTQTIWRARPKTLRVCIDGTLADGVSAKDVALAVIAALGAGKGSGYAIEYAGSCVRAMGMEGRMTLSNMSIEAGARAGMIAPDDTTFRYLKSCPHAPKGDAWTAALEDWRQLPSDDGAAFDREIALRAEDLQPMVTWGTGLDEVVPVDGRVPDPAAVEDAEQRTRMERTLEYMGLAAGTAVADVRIDRAFIGSCTNGRLDDLRTAAAVLKGRKVRMPVLVSPGSRTVKRQAEAEGLDAIFTAAGAEWGDSSCSMCVGSNGDLVGHGERCASTSPRNFVGRQGIGARTHVMSPAMAAAAAVAGHVVDVRTLMGERVGTLQ
ncbi:MAG: 3-isopropylmalate dehydratase large subunit [Burkholderiales bacterium]